MDHSGDGRVYRAGFGELCEIFDVRDDSDEDHRAAQATALGRVVTSTAFELAVDLLLVLNACVIAAQTHDALLGQQTAPETAWQYAWVWELAETAFTAIYVCEMAAKITALGWKAYATLFRNRFDCAVTVGAVLAAIYVYYPNSYDNPALIRGIVMLRLCRLVRLLVALPAFQILGESFRNMIPAAARLFKVLFCVMYAFAILGVQLFGGLVNTDANAPQLEKLKATETFFDSGYAPLNFNDFEGSFVVLFCVLVVNNWFVIVEGFVAVTSKWARLYFIFFYLIGVLVCLNVVIAFILDTFVIEFEKTRNKKRRISSNRRARMDAEHATDDAGEISPRSPRSPVSPFSPATAPDAKPSWYSFAMV